MEKDRVILLDGGVGTSLWEKTERKVAVWRYNLEDPAIVRELHEDFVKAGSEIVLANTFGANRIAMKGTDYHVPEIVSAGVRIAKETVAGRARVALSAGPLPVLLEPYGELSGQEAYEIFDEQISAGVSEHPDLIVIQTFMDIEMLKIAVKAASRHGLPIFCMMSFTKVGKTMMGNSVQDFIDGVRGLPVEAVGLNCSLGPELAVPVIKQFRQFTDLPLIFKPNAGKPIMQGGEPKVEYSVDVFVKDCLPALDCDIKYLGGCCGSNASYIRALRQALASRQA